MGLNCMGPLILRLFKINIYYELRFVESLNVELHTWWINCYVLLEFSTAWGQHPQAPTTHMFKGQP